MGEVAAVVEVHAQECVAGLEHGLEHCHVGLCARVGLHVGIFSTEELAEALDGEAFCLVDHLAAAVVAVAGIAFGIFVGEARAHCFHHLVGNEVFGGDEFNAFLLALVFALDDVENLAVALHKGLSFYSFEFCSF